MMLSKKYCLIKVYDAFNRVIELRVVPNDRQNKNYAGISNENEDRYVNDTIMRMGFNDKDDYAMSYPGNKTLNSSTIIGKLKDHTGGMWAVIEPVHIIPWQKIRDCVYQLSTDLIIRYKSNGGHFYEYSRSYLISLPTIDEIRLVNGFKTIKSKYLWFCSDWGEFDER